MIAPCHYRIGAVAKAFTLIELLVVLAIIGVLTALSLPALKGIGQANTVSSATHQMLNDLSLARQRAIVNQTTVHVVFVPTFNQMNAYQAPAITTADAAVFNDLKSGCQTTYALYAERSVGDQPGQRRPRYLTQWRSLPDGVFIASAEFDPSPNPWDRPFQLVDLPFPTPTSPTQKGVPHIAFGRNGSLVDPVGKPRFEDEYIWLTKGSVLASYDANGNVFDVNVRESPAGNWTNNFNRIRIDGVTGRAKLERLEIQ